MDSDEQETARFKRWKRLRPSTFHSSSVRQGILTDGRYAGRFGRRSDPSSSMSQRIAIARESQILMLYLEIDSPFKSDAETVYRMVAF
jgi:hypothetical protein